MLVDLSTRLGTSGDTVPPTHAALRKRDLKTTTSKDLPRGKLIGYPEIRLIRFAHERDC